jgi:hypothetical protein
MQYTIYRNYGTWHLVIDEKKWAQNVRKNIKMFGKTFPGLEKHLLIRNRLMVPFGASQRELNGKNEFKLSRYQQR